MTKQVLLRTLVLMFLAWLGGGTCILYAWSVSLDLTIYAVIYFATTVILAAGLGGYIAYRYRKDNR